MIENFISNVEIKICPGKVQNKPEFLQFGGFKKLNLF